MDPLSLALNLEANVMIRDSAFAATLATRLEILVNEHSRRITREIAGKPGYFASVRSAILYHLMRRFPSWGRMLPTPAPSVESTPPNQHQPLRPH